MRDTHTHSYTSGDLKVLWTPALCQHSGICVRGLAAVFDPRRRPWIDMTAATNDRIEAQVRQCPSGALACVRVTADE